MRFLLTFVLGFYSLILFSQGAYDIRMVLDTINCENNQFCYIVQLRSANGTEMNLAGQNYRLNYDGSKMSYLSGMSLLPTPQYDTFDLVQNIENQNASGFGSLPYDGTLSFLNYGIDLNDVTNGGIILPSDGSWVSTSKLCFQGSFDVSATPKTCIDAVWSRDGLTNGYWTAYVEVAQWNSPNNTSAAVGVTYNDINSSSAENVCISTACDTQGEYDIRMVLDTINCETNQFCYIVQLRSANGTEMNLAGQNYRLNYDGSKMSYVTGMSLLPTPQYDAYTLVQNLESQDASGFGSLPYEGTLSFLNYTMDLDDVANGGIVLPSDGSWVSTSKLCFQGSFDVTEIPKTCIDAVWSRDGLTNGYWTAFVEVAQWNSPNNTSAAVGVTYNDINSSSAENVCNSTACDTQGEYDIRMVLDTINCENNQFCYIVQLRSANGTEMNLAGQNYRMNYDGSKMSYVSGMSLLPTPQYDAYTLVQNLETQDASGFGSLSYEGTLSFLNYGIDLNDVTNGGIILPSDRSWVSTSKLCFQGSFDVSATPKTCIDAVWSRDGLTNGYWTAFVEVAQWISPNNTSAAVGVTYNDINSSSAENLCNSTACDLANIGLVKTSMYNDATGVITYTYVVHNTGNVTLTGVSVAEQIGSFTGTGTMPVPTYVSSSMGSVAGTLLVGETATYTASYAVTQADINAGNVDNQALASGTPPTGGPVTDLSDDNSPNDGNDDPTDTPLLCERPVLTVGDIACNGNNYSVNFIHNGSSISATAGSVSGTMVINIPIGTNVTVTSSNGTGCTTSATVTGPTSCPTTCSFPDLTAGHGVCTGTTYSVSLTETTGATISVSAGTRVGNTIINIPLGTNVTITATNGTCVSQIVVASPTNCTDPCVNPLISVGGTVCTSNNTTYSVKYVALSGATVTSSHGTVNSGEISGIPSGQAVTITVSFAGCMDEVVVLNTPECIALAAIGDYVWHDLNGDGQQNFGEPGIPGIQVNLWRSNGAYIATTYTDASGKYLFDFIYPGSYYVEFLSPSGFERTFSNRGNDATDSDIDGSNGPGTTPVTILAPGERDMTWDAGFYKCIPIGDLVWYDINKNDVWNTNENGINGLKVNLWRNHFGTWAIWEFKYTGHKPGTPSDDGYFNFCAPPGEYYIEVIIPPLGLVRARPNIGTNEEFDSDINSNNRSDVFSVVSGQTKTDLGAGYYPMATVGNLVWRDDNLNGVQDANEPKVEGVKVEAVEVATGKVVGFDYTDATGEYMLDYLEKQQYYLKFTPPAGFGATIARAAADNMDSDVDHSFGPNTTRSFAMEPSMVNENIDMGLAFGVLPVDWLDVNAKRVNNTHLISWSTAREVNVSHYIVERRLDTEKDFVQIPGKVIANGNTSQISQYNLTDTEVGRPGTYVYRVKQVDFDGQFTYSRWVKLSHSGEQSIDMYPNPARNETNIQVVLSNDSEVKIELLDASSKLVKLVKASSVQSAGDELYHLNLEDVAAGVYNVVITIDGVTSQRKLIRIQ